MGKFILTQDLVPIFAKIGTDVHSGAIFTCPLPKGYKKVIQRMGYAEIRQRAEKIKQEVDGKVSKLSFPFQNIFFGFQDRINKEKKRLLNLFKIGRVYIDERGVYGVWAGGNVQSGDIYLASDFSWKGCWWYGILEPFSEFFEPRTAFCCHNMDAYWQALLTREFCIEYFNWLSREISRLEG